MLVLFGVNSPDVYERSVLSQAKICVWKRYLKFLVKLAEA